MFILYNSADEYSLYTKFTKDLSGKWDVDDEGDVSDLLNIEIVRGAHHVLLRQTAYIEKMAAMPTTRLRERSSVRSMHMMPPPFRRRLA